MCIIILLSSSLSVLSFDCYHYQTVYSYLYSVCILQLPTLQNSFASNVCFCEVITAIVDSGLLCYLLELSYQRVNERIKELIAIEKINAVIIFNAWQNIVHIGNITM